MTLPPVGPYEALVQFLYRAPVGLVETSGEGAVELMNPMAAQLLMPLTQDGSLDNLFDVLEGVAPQVRGLVLAFPHDEGLVCESLRVPLPSALPSLSSPRVLSLNVWKVSRTKLMVVLADATGDVRREQEGVERLLHNASRTDALTRMPNRVVVVDRIQQSLRQDGGERDGSMAVLFLNCDRFKQINDSWGHGVGDEVLGLIADRLRSTLRQSDRVDSAAGFESVAARVGGDEFVVVLTTLRRPDDVHGVARRLLDVLAQPYGIGAQQLICTFSMGVVLQPQAKGDADVVLQNASIAMVEAKRQGGGAYVVFQPEMQARAARRGDIEAHLRTAVAGGQLFLAYQPVVGLGPATHTGGDVGVEALVRWNHPTRGVVPPLEFIGVAEETGLIGHIGEFVLETACRQFVAWRNELGPLAPRTMAVNLSRAQLLRPGFVEWVRDTLYAVGMPPTRLQLEVTESLAAQDENIQSQLHALRALGVTLALDDFGTGYSSLSSLHELPVDTVKIDRSFIREADTNHRHRVLIEVTVRVANSLGMGTVAEGIETPAQAEMVRQLGCERGQGYHFSRPLAPSALKSWVLDRRGGRAPVPAVREMVR